MNLKDAAAQAMEQRETHSAPLQKRLVDWGEEMMRSRLDECSGYPRQSTIQTARDLNYDVDQDGKDRPALPTTGKGMPTGPQHQTRTRKAPQVHLSDEAELVETCVVYACRQNQRMLKVVRAEYLHLVDMATKGVEGSRPVYRRPNIGESLTRYRQRMAPYVGVTDRHWCRLLTEAHTIIGCLLDLADSRALNVDAIRVSLRSEIAFEMALVRNAQVDD